MTDSSKTLKKAISKRDKERLPSERKKEERQFSLSIEISKDFL
jgi:hypothetical protein